MPGIIDGGRVGCSGARGIGFEAELRSNLGIASGFVFEFPDGEFVVHHEGGALGAADLHLRGVTSFGVAGGVGLDAAVGAVGKLKHGDADLFYFDIGMGFETGEDTDLFDVAHEVTQQGNGVD